MNKKIHVLYIEDVPAQREELAELLTARGFVVSEAVSGEAGIEAFDRESHDLILCDLNLPGIDGLEVLLRIRRCCAVTPFILLTAHGTIAKAVEATKRGAQSFCLKPVEIDHLEITIHQAIELARLQNRLQESENNLRSVTENVPDIIFSLNKEGRLTDISPAFESITGYLAKDVLGRTPRELVHPDDAAVFDEFDTDGPDRPGPGSKTVRFRMVASNGETKVLEANRHTILDAGGGVVRVDGIARDVTEQAALERQLAEYQKELEQKVRERTNSLEYANRQLEGLNAVSQALSRIVDEKELRQIIPRLLIQSLDFDRAGLLLLSNGELDVVSHAIDGVSHEACMEQVTRVKKELASPPPHFEEALSENKTIFVPDLLADKRWPRAAAEALQANAAVITPVRLREEPIGLLVANMQLHERSMGAHDIARFETFASMVGLAFDNLRSYQNLENTVRERTESLSDANEELRKKAKQLEISALELGHANVELLVAQEQLEEKHAELEKLAAIQARSRDELRAILDAASVPLILVNHEGVITIANRGVEPMFGLSMTETIGMSFDAFCESIEGRFEFPGSFRDRVRQVIEQNAGHPAMDEDPRSMFRESLTLKQPDGRIINLESISVDSQGDGQPGRVWSFGDITALKKADEQLRIIVDASPIPLIVSRVDDGLIIYANSHLGELMGYEVDELFGKLTPDFYYDSDDRDMLVRRLKRDGAVRDFELRLKRRDGSFIWCLLSLVVSSLAGESVIIGGIYDISARKEAEVAIRVSEERFRGLVENARGIIFSLDADACFTYLSPSFTEFLGHDIVDFIGERITTLLHPDDVPDTHQWIAGGFSSENRGEKAYTGSRLRHKDGQYLWFSADASIIKDDQDRIIEVIGVAHDITHIKAVNDELQEAYTHLKTTQSQLVRSEKMASLGLLVAGIAHEINTPIGAVNSMHNTLVRAYDRLKTSLAEDCGLDCAARDRLASLLKVIDDANRVIENGTERVTTIVRRLRSFARLDESDLKTVDVHDGIEDTLTLIHHEIKNRIEVVREFGDIPQIACFPGQLNQVFLNLLNNARQAIDGKGTIRIATSREDGKIAIRITDSGRGIAPENLEKVFDPGFTTKGVGVGTGLGLSICYQIIQDHRGEILAESRLGKGTTFTIILPMNLDEIVENEQN